MTSENQTAANQENAKLSTGPRTPEGKSTSSQNGVKHGLTGLMRLLPEEDQAEYTEHCQGIIASLKPGNPLERHLAQAIADDYWRIERIRRLELTTDPDAKTLNLYSTYESRLNRNIRSNLAELRKFRAERLEDEFQQDRTNIMVALNTGAPPPPPANGFAYAPGAFPSINELHEAEDQVANTQQAARRRHETSAEPDATPKAA